MYNLKSLTYLRPVSDDPIYLLLELITGAKKNYFKTIPLVQGPDCSAYRQLRAQIATHGINGNAHGNSLAQFILKVDNSPALIGPATTTQLMRHLRFTAFRALTDTWPG
jgi:hypothetical protein